MGQLRTQGAGSSSSSHNGQVATQSSSSSSGGGNDSSSSSGGGGGGHRARAARGPTDFAGLTATAAATGGQQEAEGKATGEQLEQEAETGQQQQQQHAKKKGDQQEGSDMQDGAADRDQQLDGKNVETERHKQQQQQVEEVELAESVEQMAAGLAVAKIDGSEGGQEQQTKQTQQQQDQQTKQQQQQEPGSLQTETDALRAASALLDASALTMLASGIRITLMTGDLQKQLLSRGKYQGVFPVVTVGQRHVHMVGVGHGLGRVVAPGGVVFAESAQYVLLLNQEKVKLFEEKVVGMAEEGGLVAWSGSAAAGGDSGGTAACSGGGRDVEVQRGVTGWPMGWQYAHGREGPAGQLVFKKPAAV